MLCNWFFPPDYIVTVWFQLPKYLHPSPRHRTSSGECCRVSYMYLKQIVLVQSYLYTIAAWWQRMFTLGSLISRVASFLLVAAERAGKPGDEATPRLMFVWLPSYPDYGSMASARGIICPLKSGHLPNQDTFYLLKGVCIREVPLYYSPPEMRTPP